jgi:hypothetical protein
MSRDRPEQLTELIALGVFHFFAEETGGHAVRLVTDDEVPHGRCWRSSDAYQSNDQLTLGRLCINKITGTPEDEITDAGYSPEKTSAERPADEMAFIDLGDRWHG